MLVNTLVKEICVYTPQYIAISDRQTLEEIITQLHEFERIVFDSSDLPIDPQRSPRFCVENDHVLSLIFT